MAEIDYHIEISTLVEFINDQIKSSTLIPISGAEIFKHIRRAVLDAEIKPFLYSSEKEDKKNYYQKYVRLKSEFDERYVPDFFESEGDFYELDKRLNIFIDNTNNYTFGILFSLKLLQLKSNNRSVDCFLDFQLYDNFYGDKLSFVNFLQELTSKDGKSHFFQSNDDEIVKWINRDDMGVLQLQSAIKKQEKLGDATNEKNHQDYINKRKGFKILGKYTDEEIRKFFSFLYLEKSTENQPILSQDVVDIIFINGLTIPQEIPKEKYSLNKSPKYSRKFIDYALHLFFSNHSFTARDKKDFVLFFACYLQDYGNALVSDSAMNNIKSNMSGKKTQKMKIKWDDYLPKK